MSDIVERLRASVEYSQNFATAKPDIGKTEFEHIAGLCDAASAAADEITRLRERLSRTPFEHLDGKHLDAPVEGCMLCEAVAERNGLRLRRVRGRIPNTVDVHPRPPRPAALLQIHRRRSWANSWANGSGQDRIRAGDRMNRPTNSRPHHSAVSWSNRVKPCRYRKGLDSPLLGTTERFYAWLSAPLGQMAGL